MIKCSRLCLYVLVQASRLRHILAGSPHQSVTLTLTGGQVYRDAPERDGRNEEIERQ